ncbi:hypothetical protein [Sulfurovum sp.]|uniref:hypothetical protein n=1 Tax=Sulfurovum sp. TaxID=1969726 RepID=UPI0035645E9F
MASIKKSFDIKLWSMSIGISIFFILAVLYLYPEVDTGEEGILEISQSIFIAFSMIGFAYHAFISKEIEAKLASFGLSLLSLTFLLRELDVEKLDIPYFLIILGSGLGRNLLLGSLWIILLILTLKYISVEKKKIVAFLFSTSGQLLMFSALLLVLGVMMDKNVFSLQLMTTRFYEELLELLAYCFLFFVSILKIKQ